MLTADDFSRQRNQLKSYRLKDDELNCARRLMVSVVFVVLAWPTTPARSDEPISPTDPHCPPAVHTNNVPIIPAATIEGMQQYQNVRSASFRGWAPDGRGILIQTRFGNTSQLHRFYTPGGRREQVTFFDEPAAGDRALPSGLMANS